MLTWLMLTNFTFTSWACTPKYIIINNYDMFTSITILVVV